MNKAQAVKNLKSILTYGDAAYLKNINETSVNRRIEYILETFLKRIEYKQLAHAEYWIAVRGIEWCLQTGRANNLYAYLHKLDIQQACSFIEDVKRACVTLGDVETYMSNFQIAA